MCDVSVYVCVCLLELKQISEISRYAFEILYPHASLELFRIVANYFKQLRNIFVKNIAMVFSNVCLKYHM